MRNTLLLLQIALLSFLSMATGSVVAKESKTVSHVVIVWLKDPGNEKQRLAFVKASEQLNDLPGIINRHVGVVHASERAIIDDTFDVAVTTTFESKEAMKAYLNNPKHKKTLKEKIKPLVNRVVAFSFISQ
jgi:heme-degrading monooxygenase HmoA